MNRIAYLGLLVALLLASLVAAQDPAGCQLCTGAEHLACVRCEGSGLLPPKDCTRCQGSGRANCRHCTASGSAKGKSRVPRGKVACRYCVKGKVRAFLSNKTERCKQCSSGYFDCVECNAGRVACACGGKPVREVCGECAGHGRVACPGCQLDPKSVDCALCRGKPKRQCVRCAGHAREAPCRACSGRGFSACERCRGRGRERCKFCGGRGSEKVLQSKGKQLVTRTRSCSKCRRQGKVKCGECAGKGREPCRHCEKGKRADLCGACAGGEVRCVGCRTSPAGSLLILAEYLVDLERYGRAVALYERARDRLVADAKKLERDRAGVVGELVKLGKSQDRAERRRLPDLLVRRFRLQAALARHRSLRKHAEREIEQVSEWVAAGR